MKRKINKKDLIGISIILMLFAFFIPFAFRTEKDSILDIFSVSLAAIGTVATVITLFIAIYLYQRFGLESRFIGAQTDKVLEIVDILKGQYFMGNTNKYSYFLGTSREKIAMTMTGPFYQSDKNKIVLINHEDFSKIWDKVLEIKRSYWLPNKIKKKIKFLEFNMFQNVEEPYDEKYIRIYSDIKKKDVKEVEWLITFPTITFDEYNKQFYELIKSIEKWLKQHSDIKIDLNMNETEKYKPKEQE